MKGFKLIATISIMLIPCLLFGFFGKTTEMMTALAAGTLAAVFLNIDKFENFKGAGIELKIRKAVDEAVATLQLVKEVSEPLFISTIVNLSWSNRLGGYNTEDKVLLMKKIEKIIEENNYLNPEVEKAIDDFYNLVSYDLFNHIKNKVREIHPKNDYKLNDLFDLKSSKRASENEIREVLSELEPFNNELEELIENYLYFKEHRQLKNI
jgi:hypothetical protein